MADLIERQAAMEALDKIFPVDPMRNDYTQGIACGAALAKIYVEQLPSAQPEIIRCKDCKWHNGEINQCNAQICASMRGEDFCSRAERREE